MKPVLVMDVAAAATGAAGMVTLAEVVTVSVLELPLVPAELLARRR